MRQVCDVVELVARKWRWLWSSATWLVWQLVCFLLLFDMRPRHL
jgi:hypothetical protein